MGLPPVTDSLRWPYAEFHGGIFRIHNRTLFSIIVICSIVFLVTIIFLYTRWVCRSGASHPLASASAVHHFQPQPSPRRGLDLSVIEKMPIVSYKNLAAGGGSRFYEAECCICLGVFVDKERVKVVQQCRHCFHSECLDMWLTTQSSCPLCRVSLEVDSFV